MKDWKQDCKKNQPETPHTTKLYNRQHGSDGFTQ